MFELFVGTLYHVQLLFDFYYLFRLLIPLCSMDHIADLHVVKDVPGFKAIMKAIVRSQIQHLVCSPFVYGCIYVHLYIT